jgi:predicted HTH transcriptional regulator
MFNRINNNNNNNNNTRLKEASHSISNFPRKKDNAGLVRLLKIIQEADKDGISTRKLCEQAFHTHNYGMRVINRAYDDGYIKRFGKNKHGHNKINYLSDKGKELLSQLQQQEEEEQ